MFHNGQHLVSFLHDSAPVFCNGFGRFIFQLFREPHFPVLCPLLDTARKTVRQPRRREEASTRGLLRNTTQLSPCGALIGESYVEENGCHDCFNLRLDLRDSVNVVERRWVVQLRTESFTEAARRSALISRQYLTCWFVCLSPALPLSPSVCLSRSHLTLFLPVAPSLPLFCCVCFCCYCCVLTRTECNLGFCHRSLSLSIKVQSVNLWLAVCLSFCPSLCVSLLVTAAVCLSLSHCLCLTLSVCLFPFVKIGNEPWSAWWCVCFEHLSMGSACTVSPPTSGDIHRDTSDPVTNNYRHTVLLKTCLGLSYIQSSGAVGKSRRPSWAPVRNSPYGLCKRRATLNCGHKAPS